MTGESSLQGPTEPRLAGRSSRPYNKWIGSATPNLSREIVPARSLRLSPANLQHHENPCDGMVLGANKPAAETARGDAGMSSKAPKAAGGEAG